MTLALGYLNIITKITVCCSVKDPAVDRYTDSDRVPSEISTMQNIEKHLLLLPSPVFAAPLGLLNLYSSSFSRR